MKLTFQGAGMQKVELYHDACEAKLAMDKCIAAGWRIHTCTLSAYMAGYTPSSKVLVVYEK